MLPPNPGTDLSSLPHSAHSTPFLFSLITVSCLFNSGVFHLLFKTVHGNVSSNHSTIILPVYKLSNGEKCELGPGKGGLGSSSVHGIPIPFWVQFIFVDPLYNWHRSSTPISLAGTLTEEASKGQNFPLRYTALHHGKLGRIRLLFRFQSMLKNVQASK